MSLSRSLDFGGTGMPVGRLAYGCWRFAGTSVAAATAKIEAALDAGMTLIDTADVYGADGDGFGTAEALLGEVLAATPGLRARMVLATKGGIDIKTPYRNDPDYMRDAMMASLRRLGVPSVDLYQVHRPDLLADPAALAECLDGFVADGLTRFIGVSNMTLAQIRALQAHMQHRIVSVQNEFSVLEQRPLTDGTLSWCQETGASFMAWSPLAGGQLFTGSGDATGAPRRLAETLSRIADRHGTDTATIALSFVAQVPGRVVPIVGTQNTSRIAAMGQAPLPRLAGREWYDLVEAYRGEPMP